MHPNLLNYNGMNQSAKCAIEFFLISEVQRYFLNELFESVEAQRNSAIAERHFRTKLKRNLTFAIEISQHNANIALFFDFRQKRVYNLLKKTDIYQNYDQNRTTFSLMCRIALLTEKKKLKAQRN